MSLCKEIRPLLRPFVFVVYNQLAWYYLVMFIHDLIIIPIVILAITKGYTEWDHRLFLRESLIDAITLYMYIQGVPNNVSILLCFMETFLTRTNYQIISLQVGLEHCYKWPLGEKTNKQTKFKI